MKSLYTWALLYNFTMCTEKFVMYSRNKFEQIPNKSDLITSKKHDQTWYCNKKCQMLSRNKNINRLQITLTCLYHFCK